MSTKKSETSRINGHKGKGPVSAAGKARSSRNSGKLGVFAKNLVLPELGERWQDLDNIRELVATSFEVVDPVEKLICDDVADNYWRRLRVRRCEAAEVRKAIPGADFIAAFDLMRDASISKEKFWRLIVERQRSTQLRVGPSDVRNPLEILADLDEVRRELHRSSIGVDFLMTNLQGMIEEAEATGTLSELSEILICACLGSSDPRASTILHMNAFLKKQGDDKGKQDAPPEPSKEQSPTEENRTDAENPSATRPPDVEKLKEMARTHLPLLIQLGRECLSVHKTVLEGSERLASEPILRAAAVLTSSQLSRAETMYDKRMYKALNTLFAIRFQKAQLELARESSRQLALKAQSRASRPRS
jgi:hypothetical protein